MRSIQLGDLLEPVNLAVLWNTAWIEAAVIAGVVIVDAGLRKRAGPGAGQATVEGWLELPHPSTATACN
jgi:hypothetical protein